MTSPLPRAKNYVDPVYQQILQSLNPQAPSPYARSTDSAPDNNIPYAYYLDSLLPPMSPPNQIDSLGSSNLPSPPPEISDASGYYTGYNNPVAPSELRSQEYSNTDIQNFINNLNGDTGSQVGNTIGMLPFDVEKIMNNPNLGSLDMQPPPIQRTSDMAQDFSQSIPQTERFDPLNSQSGGMRRGGKVKRYDEGDLVTSDDGGDALTGDLGLGGIDLSSIGNAGIGNFDFSGLDLSSLKNLGSGLGDANLASFMDSIYGSPNMSNSNSSTDLSSLLDSSDLASLVDSTDNKSTKLDDVLKTIEDEDLNGGRSPIDLTTLTNGGVQNFGEGTITDKNLQEMQDSYTNAYDNKGGYMNGYQTVGDNKIMVHDDGSATFINTKTGDTGTLPASTVDTMTNAGVINSSGSGYNKTTGGTDIAPGGGKTVVNTDGSKTTTMPDGTKVKVDTDGTTSVIPPGGTTKTGGSTTTTSTKAPTDNSQSNLLALLALMALMNQGGGSGGSGFQIPTFKAERGVIPGQVNYTKAAGGGMMGSGIASLQGHLGGYSDGGRLLKGPGDGVSDDIPATIGGKEPARLADGEFVIPARIVSELGNGSTDAGARKLYAMMDRVKQTRSKAKDIAADTKADKHLPA